MNEELIKIMFDVSGLPASAMVAHACLDEDLGFDKQAMPDFILRINSAFDVCIPQKVWSGFERARDINDYLKKIKNGDDN
jgi:acyl carrier protein